MADTPASRTALIFGASGRLGGALAACLAARGYRLELQAFRHPERCGQIPGARVHTLDLRDPSQIKALAQSLKDSCPRLEALVWAAGAVHDQIAARLTEEVVAEVLAVNLGGFFGVCKHFSRQFLRQKSGSVVAFSSHAAFSGRVGGAAYSMAQSGILAAVKSLAREWGPSGIRVNAVVPPFIRDSGMGQAASPEFEAVVRRRSVLPRPAGEASGLPDAVARFVAELIDQPSASGQVFVLDSRIAGA